MTKEEAIRQVAAAAVKHEKKYGTGSAKMEELPNAIVLAARFPPDKTHYFLSKKRYGLPAPHDIRGRRVVRYAVRFA